MQQLLMIPVLQISAAPMLVLMLLLQPQIIHADEAFLRQPQHTAFVLTNQGRATESYRAPGYSAVVEHSEITSDIPWVQVFSTNLDGRVYECLLTQSQLKAAPGWAADKTPPPLSPRQARRIAVEQAFKAFGPSRYGIFDFDPSHHWLVVNLELVSAWGGWDRGSVWYYRVGVKRRVIGSSPGIPDARIFITMDGKAAPYVQMRTAKSTHQ